jgi:hypothetical protein
VKVAVLGVEQDVGEDGQRLAGFDDVLDELERAKKRVAGYLKLHELYSSSVEKENLGVVVVGPVDNRGPKAIARPAAGARRVTDRGREQEAVVDEPGITAPWRARCTSALTRSGWC